MLHNVEMYVRRITTMPDHSNHPEIIPAVGVGSVHTGQVCLFTITVGGDGTVPAGKKFYTFQIGAHPPTTVDESSLTHVALSLAGLL